MALSLQTKEYLDKTTHFYDFLKLKGLFASSNFKLLLFILKIAKKNYKFVVYFMLSSTIF
jgi:hypothetical protein